jgi:hypothetical protein
MTIRPGAARRAAAPLLVVVTLVALGTGVSALRGKALALRTATPIEARVTVPPPGMARLASGRYNELAADLAWVRTLVHYGSMLEQGLGIRDLEALLAVTNALDPWFKAPYRWGSNALVFTERAGQRLLTNADDLLASVRLLERAIQRFPDDWEFRWQLGLMYYLDLPADDPDGRRRLQEIGAAYMEQAMRRPGAPDDLPLVAASLRTRLGQKDRALANLREMIMSTRDPAARRKLEERYAALASEEASQAIAEAARAFEAEWRAHLPYAPETLHVLVGPRPPEALDPAALADVAVVELLDDAGAPVGP